MKRSFAILLVPLAVACARSEAAAPATEPVAAVAPAAPAPAKPAAAKKVTLLVSGDVGGKYAPCG